MESTPSPGRRDVLTAVAVIACGAAWVSQLFLPWAGVGALSASTGADVWRLSRNGLIPSSQARWVPALAVLPVLGVCALAMSGVTGVRPRCVRLVVVAAGLVVGLFLVAGFGSTVDGQGPGLLLTAAASGMAALLAVAEVVRFRSGAVAGARTEV